MADGTANHLFLAWAQPGSAALLPASATERLAADQTASIALPLKLTVNGAGVQQTVRLYGPGDVVGFDPQQVVRVEPAPLSTDFEPNYLPLIELARPDLPWLLTPLRPDTQGRLRPWLCLVVVEKQPGVTLAPATGAPLPVLSIAAPASPGRELPDLAESQLWAHAQVTGADPAALPGVLSSDPTRSLSRLLAPRRLDPATDYVACLVPTFEVGRKAGLGLAVATTDTLAPAWLAGAAAPAAIQLPVYYSWPFRTGAGGDFEELARRLAPRELPPEVGKRPMDVSQPGFALTPPPAPGAPPATLGLEGALRVVGATSDPWPDGQRVPFQAALMPILNTPWDLATTAAAAGTTTDPVLGPPVYGCWQAAVHEVPASPTSLSPSTPPPTPHAPAPPTTWPPPFWLDELNLDPRTRVAAATGTAVIQQQQEQLVAAAWEQLGDIRAVNQRLRQAQLSREVGGKYLAKTFNRLPDQAFARVIAPAQSRLDVAPPPGAPAAPGTPAAAAPLLVQAFAAAAVPTTAVSSPLRKLTRPRGPLNRQYANAGAPGVNAVLDLFGAAAAAPASTVATPGRGAVSIEDVTARFSVANGDRAAMSPVERTLFDLMVAKFHLSSITGPALVNAVGSPYMDAMRLHEQYLSSLFPVRVIFIGTLRPALSAQVVKASALGSLNPAATVSRTALPALVIGSPRALTGDDLEPVMDAPSFPQPMYEALRDVSQDLLFPGLELVPPNTVQLLETNTRFIEAFMVGLNSEMGRELLWRGYPTDQRGTYFQQFWDAVPEARPDLPPIRSWGQKPLGSNAAGAGTSGGGAQLVLLIRGELLRRYPNAIIYAVRAVAAGGRHALSTVPADEVYPVFRGNLNPDVTFLGFNLTRDDALSGQGYFFVIQEHPTAPRFGLDDAPFSAAGDGGAIPPLQTWDDLNWGQLAPTPEALAALSYISVGKVNLTPAQDRPPHAIWGRNAGHMAYITKQTPVRVAIHARRLIPPA
jgi:hypothetical protein